MEKANSIEELFTKNELLRILSEKKLPIKQNLRKDYLLVEISKFGFIPKCYRKVPCFFCGNPVIVINQKPLEERIDYSLCKDCSSCKKCGKNIDTEKLTIETLKIAKSEGLYCSDCEKEMKQLNKNTIDLKLF